MTLVRSINDQILTPLKQSFVGKDEIIDLLGVSLISGENLFLLGPPGTAKSALVRSLSQLLGGRVFDYLLTKFTEPAELFGPFDIRKLREGDLVTNTEGMLPEADFVFLDELLNANSSILNSLLMALNERVFRRGRETRTLPALFFVGASNRLPEDETLGALFDRFLLRVRCDNVADELLPQVLLAGWKLESRKAIETEGISIDSIRDFQRQVHQIDLEPVIPAYLDLIRQIRRVGIEISDRRAVRLQRPIAASAILCNRSSAHPSDLWILKHIWDTVEQQEVLTGIVQPVVAQAADQSSVAIHPQAADPNIPDAERISAAIDRLFVESEELFASKEALSPIDPCQLIRDQLASLSTRMQWISDATQKKVLEEKCQTLWDKLKSYEIRS